jgi:hypothetical protein
MDPGYDNAVTYDVTDEGLTPEPATWALFGLGLPLAWWWRRRQRGAATQTRP